MADEYDTEDIIAQMHEEAQNAATLMSQREQVLSSNQSSSIDMDELFGNAQNISINDLMERAGITAQDFQALCDEDPTMIQRIGGGKTCDKLSGSAYNITNGKKLEGHCLAGVQGIFNEAGLSDSLAIQAPKVQEIRESKPYQGSSNGGAVGYIALEEGNNFITVSIDNKAYGTANNLFSDENNDMNALFSRCRPGVVMTVDDIEDETLRIQKGDNGGGRYGHIAVATNQCIGNSRVWGSDGEQLLFNFPRYGEKAHACFPKDAMVEREDAERLVTIALKRRNRELEEAGYAQAINPKTVLLDVAPVEVSSQTIEPKLISMVIQKSRIGRT